MNNFFMKILAKTPKIGSMARIALEVKFIPFFKITDIMVDTLKFTSESKVWNNFCAGCSFKEMPRHLSPNLYSGRAKGQVWGDLVDDH